MESNFQRALARTLKEEGGWSDDVRDPGGATQHGITLKTYRQYKANASKDDLRNISDDEVARIYRDGYWSPIKGDSLPAGVDLAVFDFGVNSGVSRAAKYLQRLAGVPVDGIIGSVTLRAVGAVDEPYLINQLCNDRLDFLRGLSTWGTFGKGWTGRVERIRAAALEMAAKPVAVDRASGADPVPASGSVGDRIAALEAEVANLKAWRASMTA